MNSNLTFFVALFLMFFSFSEVSAQKPSLDCSGPCQSATLGGYNPNHNEMAYFVDDASDMVDDLGYVPQNLPNERFCVSGSVDNLCPHYRLAVSVYRNSTLILSKSYAQPCYDSGSGDNDFFFTVTGSQLDIITVASAIAPVPGYLCEHTCKWQGTADIKLCRED